MKHCKYFFIVYAIAILSSVGANGATVTGLATPEYVKGAINSLPAVARSGSYNDLLNKPTIPAAQVNSDWNATSGKAQILNKPTLGAMAAKSNVTNADISGTINQDKITGLTTALNGKQPTLTTGDTGNIKGTGSVTVTKDATTGVITVNGTDTKYTLPAANGTTRGGVITGGDITATNGTLTITDGKVTSAKIANGTIVNADISDSAAIAVTKISGAQTTNNMVHAVADMTVGNRESTTMYPSMKVAQQIAMEVTSDDITGLKSDVETIQNRLDTVEGITVTTTTGNGMVKTVSKDDDGNIVATRGMVTSADITDGTIAAADLASNSVTTVKITDGNVTEAKIGANAVTTAKIKDANVTTAKIADKNVTTGKIADAAVTPAKTSGVIGKIPSGSATATTYAQIWVQ